MYIRTNFQGSQKIDRLHSLFVCLFEVYRPTREFLTHMKTSLLPVMGCKC